MEPPHVRTVDRRRRLGSKILSNNFIFTWNHGPTAYFLEKNSVQPTTYCVAYVQIIHIRGLDSVHGSTSCAERVNCPVTRGDHKAAWSCTTVSANYHW